MQWTFDRFAEAAGGALTPAPDGTPVTSDHVVGVSIDSRTIGRGEAFVALRAERDGHEFLDAAARAGVGLAVVDPGGASLAPAGLALVVVDDTREALIRLGRAARDRLDGGTVVGITGSVGKTTTKDLLASIGALRGTVAAPQRSFNNELGVPLTLLAAEENTRLAVIEMGARGLGHVRRLCEIARPRIGVVTAVGAAHLETFGDLATVALAKGELVESLPVDGTAVLNGDDPRVAAMAGRTRANVIEFGRAGSVRASAISLDDDLRAAFRLESPWGSVDVRLPIAGVHQVANALAAATAALVDGASLEQVAGGLAMATVSPWRMEVHRLASGAVVVNDAYNANPTSMRAALDSIAAVPATRRIAVLGAMAELGPDAAALHADVSSYAAALGIEVIAVESSWYDAVPVGVGAVESALGPLGEGVVVLVKASRSSGLEQVADRLVDGGVGR